MPTVTCLNTRPSRLTCGAGPVELTVVASINNDRSESFAVVVQPAVGPDADSLTPVGPQREFTFPPGDHAVNRLSVTLDDPETNQLLPCPATVGDVETFAADALKVSERPIGLGGLSPADRLSPLVEMV